MVFSRKVFNNHVAFHLRLRWRLRGLEIYLISCKTGLFVMISSFCNWFPIDSICDEKAIVTITSEPICHLGEPTRYINLRNISCEKFRVLRTYLTLTKRSYQISKNYNHSTVINSGSYHLIFLLITDN